MTAQMQVDDDVMARAQGMRDLVRGEAAESERLRTMSPCSLRVL